MKRIVIGLLVLCAMTTMVLPAQTYTTLFSFNGRDGARPGATLIEATDGNLYGTTIARGAYGHGTVFKISPTGALTTLHDFCSQSGCPDGAEPGGLIQATDRGLYGTTYYGGANHEGSVFKITTSGSLTTMYSFCAKAGCTDGEHPIMGLVQATDGEFYGTTETGGVGTYGSSGTVFKITSNGTLTTLHSFCSQSGCPDGQILYAGLVQATNRDLYGTTYMGGVNHQGTIFKISLSGTLTTLYSFCSRSSCADGAGPSAALVQSNDGELYGTTAGGGSSGYGTVFRITQGGALTTLHNFCGHSGCMDGAAPTAELIQANDSNFYGTTYNGGAYGGGTIFKINRRGMLTTLYNFCFESNCRDGETLYAGLVQDTNGIFYGATYAGGEHGDGTVFSLSVGLGPFVKTLPTSGKVGARVTILGTDLIGATSVNFNGTAAVFTVRSASEIITGIPTGATTGTVQVVTPGGTLSSNVPFRVR
jgi:uncharacterized repeat protein (TIGR03803 family)